MMPEMIPTSETKTDAHCAEIDVVEQRNLPLEQLCSIILETERQSKAYEEGDGYHQR
jgi:hypothetical protein